MTQPARKSTQRERLLKGMVDTANRRGYAGASVSAVIEEAGVSRPTFYEYFSGRDDCFSAAIEDAQVGLLAATEEALGAATHTAMAAAVGALVRFASAEPARSRFLMGEAMAGGKPALDTRDRGIVQIAKAIEKSTVSGTADAAAPDLEARVVIGSIYRMLAKRLRRGETSIAKLNEELLGWIAAYERPTGKRRWQKLTPGVEPPPPEEPLPVLPTQRMQSVLPPGRPRIPEHQIAENHRLRVLYAVAQLAEEKGYTATTVSAITKLARIDGTAFYRLFSDKQEAFTAVHELCFQQVMDATAKGFFAGEDWPRRSWDGARALTQLLQANTRLAHVGFVEAYAVGSSALQRIEDSHVAFMFFLQEGLVHRHTPIPSRVAMEATVAAIFEIVYLDTRRDGEPRIASMVSHVAHVWLTPFMGIEEADAFIDAREMSVSPKRKRARAR